MKLRCREILGDLDRRCKGSIDQPGYLVDSRMATAANDRDRRFEQPGDGLFLQLPAKAVGITGNMLPAATIGFKGLAHLTGVDRGRQEPQQFKT